MNTSCKDLVTELSKVLIAFLSPLNLKFYFSDIELPIKEVFMKDGFMPFFLYDKQPFIDHHLRHKKSEWSDESLFAKLQLVKTNSFLDIKINITHNLFDDGCITNEKTDYYNLLFSLATKILSEDSLIIKDNCIYLDNFFTEFNSYLTKNQINLNSYNKQL